MVWIWQHADWPIFTWDQSRLAPLEARFLHESGRRAGAWRHLAEGDRTELRIEWLSGEALDTSAIGPVPDFLGYASAIPPSVSVMNPGSREHPPSINARISPRSASKDSALTWR